MVAVTGCLACPATAAGSNAFAPEALVQPLAGATVYLEVILNNVPTGLIAAFTERADGSLAISQAELTELGLAADPAALGLDGQFELGRIAGLSYRYDRVTQTVDIVVGPSRLALRRLDARSGLPSDMKATAGTGAVLNYQLYGTLDRDFAASLAGSFDGRVYSSLGVLNQSAILAYKPDQGFGAVRLDTTFTYSSPGSLVTWRAGDIVSGGLSWTRPVRLGGAQSARDFTLRPDLVTMPLPEFADTAAVPSTVDIYAKGAHLYSTNVPAGPYNIANIPIVSGSGVARVVVTDALGRTRETGLPFFASTALLAKGLFDFSAEAGFPRRSYGVLSNDYASTFAASGSVRYGATDRLTLEAHGEGAAGLANLGFGVLTPLGPIGLASLAGAVSGGEHKGVMVNADLDLQFSSVGLRLRTFRTFGDYADIASISADPSNLDAAPPRALDQVSLSLPVGPDRSLAALTYTRLTSASGTDRKILGLAYGRRVFGNANFFASAFLSLDGDAGSGFYLGLSRPMPYGATATAGVGGGPGGHRGNIDIIKPEGPAFGDVGWRVAGGLGETANFLAAASTRTEAAHFAGSLRGTGSDVALTGEVTGAVAIADGGIFLSNRIGDAFAVVDVGAPGVTVLSENRPAGKTGATGKLLVPYLRSWQANHLSIDPEGLPLDADARATEAVVVPRGRSGVTVEFGIASNKRAARVILSDAKGQPLPAGLVGRLDSGDEFVVGYDGEAYIDGLAAKNTIVVVLEDGSDCRASFGFQPRKDEQVVIDGVVCR